jgi:hypothetical protein
VRIIASPPPAAVRITDLNGQVLAEMIPWRNEMPLDLSGVGNGIFFLEGTYAQGKRVVPFIVYSD